MKKILTASLILASLSGCGGDSSSESVAFTSEAALGEALFSDVNLSANRTQSCATCHDPERAFTDGRTDAADKVRPVSLGDDGVSLGDRNAPTALYAMFSPQFSSGTRSRFNSQQDDYEGYLGGQFHDGRATDLAAQAGGPPLNPLEMGMADQASVVARLRENSDYDASFRKLFGNSVFDDTATAYNAMTSAIAAFEKTSTFATFDSAYDRYLAGDDEVYDVLLHPKAALGKTLFFSQQFTNCATCHQLAAQGNKKETFTGYEYHNIGVPVNSAARTANGVTAIDTGLQTNNDAVSADTEKGKFKVPTLRNVAVTGPYMHNGVFAELDTVIRFYDHWLTGSANSLNPETGVAWADPEVSDTISLTELKDGSLLNDDDVDALVCFLRTLTDARYEALLPDDGLCD
ncbi:cytochrome-c peroxidase [Thalassolituus sp. LLYu03]|uniref:cytochrome-c peroxidase n=1 Tax=Thalassolituus sp. LLYu03 TaxID=3421656 RepID=UPI003D28494E